MAKPEAPPRRDELYQQRISTTSEQMLWSGLSAPVRGYYFTQPAHYFTAAKNSIEFAKVQGRQSVYLFTNLTRSFSDFVFIFGASDLKSNL